MSEFILAVLVRFEWLVLGYFLLVNGWYLILLVSAVLEMRRHANLTYGQNRWKVLSSPVAPSISILAPAHNEAATIVESLSALLTLQYPNLEVVVINDGSKDRTLDVLREHFHLTPVHPIYQRRIVTQPVRGLYRSSAYPHLVVIDKENGRKADALNAGLNVATGTLICAIDMDTIIEADALQRLVRPFLESGDVVAAGGTIRIANACVVRSGRVLEARVPLVPTAAFQVVEYIRAFLFGRLGWNRLGGNLIISGAFGLFRRDAVLDCGGYAHDSIGEDFELILRLRRHGYDQHKRHRVTFVPDPVAWTEVPETLKDLGSQRDRWHRGLADTLWRHRDVFMKPRYGAMGMVAFPYFVIVELLAPVVEMFGLCALAIGLALHAFDAPFALMFFLFAYGFGALLTIISITMDELCLGRYTRMRDRALLVLWTLAENLGYRQLTVYWRLRGFEKFFRRQQAWGDMKRKGFGPAAATAPTDTTPAGRAASVALALALIGTAAAGAHAQSAADSAFLRGERSLAQALYAKQLETDPRDATALHRSALLYAWDRQWPQSLELFDRLIALQPEDLDARVDRARVRAWKGDLDGALHDLNTVLTKEPEHAAALCARARFAAWRGDLRAAERDWYHALAVNPHSAEAFAGLAQTLRWQGRMGIAIRAARAALLLAPRDETARAELEILESGRAPRVMPRIIHETDSDGNSIQTWLLGGTYALTSAATLSGSIYTRSAAFHSGSFQTDASPRGASLIVTTALEPGWHLSTELGASDVHAAGLDPVATLGVSVATPVRDAVHAALAFRHAGFDATALVAARGVVVSEATLNVTARLAGAQVQADANIGSWHGRLSGASNQRLGGRIEMTRVLYRQLALGAAVRGFRFQHDLNDGYFDPAGYVLSELLGRWEYETGAWRLTADGGTGIQHISGENGTWAFRMAASAAWQFATARSITLSVTHANARTNAFAAEAPTAYRYTSLSLGASWRR
jgi:cellulose synthase/poly-beta-1,6-N-acetylglucosamine synthase-like glycosyltransferase/tetratricopeptide (TPR) repeat protein